jgi:serine/threonine-protein kinase
MSLSLEPDRNLGRTLGGQYRVDSLLGEGGMGRVYRGLQLSVNRAVAIKVITGTPPHQLEWAQRFRREAEATARLSHPNTVRLFDFGVTSEQELYIVMELLEGATLAEHLDEHGPLPLNDALAVGRQVVCALSEAHALGIIHRDLKPENVFLARVRGGETVAKVMDFGIAGLAHPRKTDKLTLTGAVLGTPAYMSPEQAQGRVVDARSDVYSFGVMLFEMLAGRTPYEADTAVSALVAHVTQPPKRLHEVGARTPRQAEVQALLDALLAKDPSARPASANELLDALDALAGQSSQPSAATRRSSKPLAITATALATETPDRPSYTSAMRSRWRPLLIGLGVAIAASGALALRYSPAPAKQPPLAAAEVVSPPSAAKTVVHRVTLASVPSGASVLFEGAELGKTPYLFEFKRASELQLVKRGYRRELVRVSAGSEPNIVIDLVRDKSLPEPEPPKPVASRATLEPAAVSGSPLQPSSPEPAPGVDPPVTVSGAAYAPEQPALIAADAPQPPVAATETTRSAVSDPHEERAVYDGLSGSRPDDEVEHPRRHRLRAAAHAIGRWMGRMLGGGGTPNERVRRQALLRQDLPYPTFAEAERAYNHREIDRDRYEDVLWALRERRRQRIEAEKFNLARGLITRPEYEGRLDRIGAEFRGR